MALGEKSKSEICLAEEEIRRLSSGSSHEDFPDSNDAAKELFATVAQGRE